VVKQDLMAMRSATCSGRREEGRLSSAWDGAGGFECVSGSDPRDTGRRSCFGSQSPQGLALDSRAWSRRTRLDLAACPGEANPKKSRLCDWERVLVGQIVGGAKTVGLPAGMKTYYTLYGRLQSGLRVRKGWDSLWHTLCYTALNLDGDG
jgi:hypothetical protein